LWCAVVRRPTSRKPYDRLWITGSRRQRFQSAIIKEWADREKVDVKVRLHNEPGQLLYAGVGSTGRSAILMEFTTGVGAVHQPLDSVDDIIKSVVARNGPMIQRFEYLGNFEGGGWAPMSGDAFSLLFAVRVDEGACGHRRPGIYRRQATRSQADMGHLPCAAEKCKGRLWLRVTSAPHRHQQWVGAFFCLWRRTHGCQGEHNGQTTPSAGLGTARSSRFCPADARLGRRVEQQWLISGRCVDFQPPARGPSPSANAPKVREVLDAWLFRRGRKVVPIRSSRVSMVFGASRRQGAAKTCSSTSLCVECEKQVGRAKATISRRTQSSTTSRLDEEGHPRLDLALSDQRRRSGRRYVLTSPSAYRPPDLAQIGQAHIVRLFKASRWIDARWLKRS